MFCSGSLEKAKETYSQGFHFGGNFLIWENLTPKFMKEDSLEKIIKLRKSGESKKIQKNSSLLCSKIGILEKKKPLVIHCLYSFTEKMFYGLVNNLI